MGVGENAPPGSQGIPEDTSIVRTHRKPEGESASGCRLQSPGSLTGWRREEIGLRAADREWPAQAQSAPSGADEPNVLPQK